MWKIRLVEESRKCIANSFLTLTYNDANIPPEGLQKRDIQLFIKKMRKRFKFRYYLIGEYGPTTYRPHYHAIMFGIDNNTCRDMEIIVEDVWGHGFITLEPITETRINYIAEYHVNRFNYPQGQEPTFKLLSTRPAIGSNYIERESQFHWGVEQMYYRSGAFKLSLPRYYKEKLYDRKTRLIASTINQKASDVEEVKKVMRDPQYYRKRAQNVSNMIALYQDKKRKNKKL